MTGAYDCRSFLRQLHRAFEFHRLFFDTEILGVKTVDLGQIIGSERRAFRRFGEFHQLLFIVNVGQRRSDAVVGQATIGVRLVPSVRLGFFQEPEFLDLF